MNYPKTPFSTRLSGGAKETELRIRSIFRWKKKRPPVWLLAVILLVVLCCGGLVSCRLADPPPVATQPPASSATVPPTPVAPSPTSEIITNDRPTIPADAAEGTEYLYDFRFSERYDARVTTDFSLTFPESVGLGPLALLARYESSLEPVAETSYDSDGMRPHKYREYAYQIDGAHLWIKTEWYEPDGVEYVSCIRTDLPGAVTDRGVGVGSTEAELLAAYPEALYYMDQEEPSDFRLMVVPGYKRMDGVYVWQPFTPGNNECRDITFCLYEGVVTSVELMSPYELRYVYGCDREEALRLTEERREKYR